jgi:hypothetical protein
MVKVRLSRRVDQAGGNELTAPNRTHRSHSAVINADCGERFQHVSWCSPQSFRSQKAGNLPIGHKKTPREECCKNVTAVVCVKFLRNLYHCGGGVNTPQVRGPMMSGLSSRTRHLDGPDAPRPQAGLRCRYGMQAVGRTGQSRVEVKFMDGREYIGEK